MASLEVFVAPLCRYFSGDLSDATEPAGVAAGAAPRRRSAPERRPLPPQHAAEFISGLQRKFAGTLAADLPWLDEGETVLASQVPADAWHALRAFAVDEYYPVPGFTYGPGSHEHPGLGRVMTGGRCGFRHLIRQHEHQGFYLPADFPSPFALPDWPGEGPAPFVGSSISLLRELNHLRRALGLSYDLGDERWAEQLDADDPLQRVKSGWVFLRHAARLSVKHKLPMVLALAGA